MGLVRRAAGARFGSAAGWGTVGVAAATLMVRAIFGATAAGTHRRIAADRGEREANGGEEVDEKDADHARLTREATSPSPTSRIPHGAKEPGLRCRSVAIMLYRQRAKVKRAASGGASGAADHPGGPGPRRRPATA